MIEPCTKGDPGHGGRVDADGHVHLKTSLDHLPESKRHQLKRITECICQTVPLDRLILFGSYARGDWVEAPANITPPVGWVERSETHLNAIGPHQAPSKDAAPNPL